jgi:hypothetical protein
LRFEGDLFEEITPHVLVVHAIFHEAIAHLEAARQVPQDAGRLRRSGTAVPRQDGHEARREDHERHPPDGAVAHIAAVEPTRPLGEGDPSAEGVHPVLRRRAILDRVHLGHHAS